MPPAAPDSRAPRCGRCNYIVRGLASFTCPECGNDLREVGIDVGQKRPSGWTPIVVLAVVWGVLIAIAAQMVWDSLQRDAPRVAALAYNVGLQKPASGQYMQLLIEGHLEKSVSVNASFLASSVLPKTKLTLMSEHGPIGALIVDLAGDIYADATPGGTPASPQPYLGQATLLEWMSRCTGQSTPQLRAEAADVAVLLRTSINQHQGVLNIRNGSFSVGSSSTGMNYTNTWSNAGEGTFGSASGTAVISSHMPIWYVLTVALGSLALWLVVVVWLVKRLRQKAAIAPLST